ncbi:MAG: protein kinase, partial [Planctomycetota bacterium]
APRAKALPGADTFPGYEIKREIHRGGQGVVYLANQLATKRRVAIKVMHGGSTLGTTGRARFDREVQLLGQLNHPNVVNLHDSGVTSDGSLFCVMDYISGKALDEVLRERRRERQGREESGRSRSRVSEINDVESTLRFFAKVCDGVNAAHLKGVVHRDIKPANVRVDQSGEPVLVDFGLAKVTAGVESDSDPSSPMTMTGQFIGSLPWASPEQATGSGDAIDLRTDVYSLGVMLYQMLTGGKFPYSVIGNMRDVLDNIQRAEPARPSTIRRQINDEVETIVLKALAKDRERRYQSAGELGRDIRHYLAGEPIQAKRDSGWYLIRKTMARHKAVAGFALAASIIITGSAVGMTAMWNQAEGARAAAVVERDNAEDNLDAARDLARTMLYEFGDSIKNLRGATEARELVLDKALEYLALLGAQPDPSDELLAELADAHQRVGDLAGEIYGANTGTTVDAMSHYVTARDIREDLLQRDPANKDLLAALAGSHRSIGQASFKAADYAGALESLERSAEIATRSGSQRAHLQALHFIGDIHLRFVEDADELTADVESHIAEADRVFGIADALWQVSEAPDATRERAKLLFRRSQLRLVEARGRFADDAERQGAEALFDQSTEYASEAVDVLERLSEAASQDYDLARDYWVAVHHLAQSRAEAAELYTEAGSDDLARRERSAAIEGFERCVLIAREMTADRSNIEAIRDLVVSLNKLGNQLLADGRLAEAKAAYTESMDNRRQLYAADPVQRHLRDLAVGQFKLAQVDEARADAAAGETERRALLELSLAQYQEAQRHFRDYTERGGPGQRFVDLIGGEIDRVRAVLQDN